MAEPRRVQVFLSYSHDSPAHREQVLRLAARLARDGLEVRLDQFVPGSPAQGWPRWMLDQLDWADYVLVVCTDTYYRRFRGHEEPGKGKGADWEGALITAAIYEARSRARKFVPVLFESSAEPFIPEPLRGRAFHVLNSEAPYIALYRFLTNQPELHPVPRGELVPLPARSVAPLRWEDGGTGQAVEEAQKANAGRSASSARSLRQPALWGVLAVVLVLLGVILALVLRRPPPAEQSLGAALDELLATLGKGKPVATGFWAEAGTTTNGPWRRLRDGDSFRTNEFLRLGLHLRQPAFLYLLNKDGQGKAEVLLPEVAQERLSRGRAGPWDAGDYRFPEMVAEAPLFFTEAPGKESFVLFASSTELTELPQVLSAFAQAGREKAADAANAGARRWREGDLRFASVLRTGAGYASQSAGQAEAGKAKEAELPLFTGQDTATVLTLNLRLEE